MDIEKKRVVINSLVFNEFPVLIVLLRQQRPHYCTIAGIQVTSDTVGSNMDSMPRLQKRALKTGLKRKTKLLQTDSKRNRVTETAKG